MRRCDIPDQSPKNGDSEKESHDASDPHSGNHAGVGVKREKQRLIHPSVRDPWRGERKEGTDDLEGRAVKGKERKGSR